MSLQETTSTGVAMKLPDVGLQPARCFAIVDVGTHLKTFKNQPQINEKTGKQVQANELLIYWELPKFMNPTLDGRPPFPSRVKQQYTFSAGDKAKLPDVLKSWGPLKERPKAIGIELLKKFVGHKCMLNIEHSKDGKYANVGSSGRGVNPWMKELPEPTKCNDYILFNMDQFTWESFYELPSYAQKMIRKSIEFPAISAKMPEPVKADSAGAVDSFEDENAPVVGGSADEDQF